MRESCQRTEEGRGHGLICIITRLRGLPRGERTEWGRRGRGTRGEAAALAHGTVGGTVGDGSCAMDHGVSLGAQG